MCGDDCTFPHTDTIRNETTFHIMLPTYPQDHNRGTFPLLNAPSPLTSSQLVQNTQLALLYSNQQIRIYLPNLPKSSSHYSSPDCSISPRRTRSLLSLRSMRLYQSLYLCATISKSGFWICEEIALCISFIFSLSVLVLARK